MLGLKKLKNLSAFLLLLPTILWANITVQNVPVPGGVAVVDFTTNHHAPRAFYKTRPLYVQHVKDQHWQVLIGIPLLEKLGKKTIKIQDFSTRTSTFEVKNHSYKEQHITLKNNKKKYLNPNLAHSSRIKKERPILTQARQTFSPQTLANQTFIRPVAGITTGAFGLKRFYNGKSRRAHTGIDYASDIGTPIKAGANGKVILVGNFFFNGNAVFLDHGQGLISVYIHMNKRLVGAGQSVKKGDIIGTVGQTGRATAAHLHWGVYLNQTAVNPNLFLNADAL